LATSARELRDALLAAADDATISRLVRRYELAFGRWVDACRIDLSRSSFDQENASEGAAAAAP
jgi:hypothetical protein